MKTRSVHIITITYNFFLPVSTIYKVKDFSEGTFLNFRLCDTRGFEEEFALDAQEMSFILDGNIPDRYQVIHFSHVPKNLFLIIISK